MSHIQQLEERLVRSFMSGWQRRGCSLLQVGLHSYIAPEFFWDAGFDVCATDENIHALNYALDCSGPRVEYQLAKVDSLPFDDDSFDYAFFSCYVSPYYKSMKTITEESKASKSRMGKAKPEESKPEDSEIETSIIGKTKSLDLSTENSMGQTLQAKKTIQKQNTKADAEEMLASMPSFLTNSTFKTLFGETSTGEKLTGEKLLAESNIFSETCRVAQKGVIILCKNSLSIRDLPALGNTINPLLLWKTAKNNFPKGEVKIATSLVLPRFIRQRFNTLDVHSHVLPFGELLGICINFNTPAVTGIGVLSKVTKKKKLVEEPAVSRANVRNK